MSTCRACEARQEQTGTTSVLVLRAWREADGVRCRFVAVPSPDDPAPEPPVRVAQGADDVCAAVRVWLAAL
jgi:hypothetical protein